MESVPPRPGEPVDGGNVSLGKPLASTGAAFPKGCPASAAGFHLCYGLGCH